MRGPVFAADVVLSTLALVRPGEPPAGRSHFVLGAHSTPSGAGERQMQELHFTLTCTSCGADFTRSVERPRAPGAIITLYCRHCGCPHHVEPGDGVTRERWSTADAQPPSSAAADRVPET
jgi:hypothetical protein